MGMQKLLLILHLLLLSRFVHCYASSLEEKSPGYVAEASPSDESAAQAVDFSGVMSRAGRLGHGLLRRSPLARSSKVVNVKDFGAKGDGFSDDTKAFTAGWKAACSSTAAVTLLVPGNKIYLLKPITLSGPCKSYITVTIKGTILASPNRSDWDRTNLRHWVLFDRVKNLRVEGGGTFNGNGPTWWRNSCKIDESLPCTQAPTALTFNSCSSLNVDNLKFRDSQKIHVSFERCTNAHVSNLVISAPERSPNTDGIHVTGSTNIWINNCVIGTGDDCISIVSGSRFVNATNIYCGPGHGLSIGSLGANGSEDTVSDVIVHTAQLDGTTNGVRIKTWQGGKGYAKDITFKNVYMKNVQNPIIINQHYCDSKKACTAQKSAVAISGVTYKNITGTSATSMAVKFKCSKSIPCRGILLRDINLALAGGGSAKSTCSNVYLSKSGTIVPSLCTS